MLLVTDIWKIGAADVRVPTYVSVEVLVQLIV